MLNLQKQFLSFNDNIRITKAKKESIFTSRDAIRDKIRNHFKQNLGLKQPLFKVQGSFTIHTSLNPLDEAEVDLDDGVYLTHFQGKDKIIKPQDAHKLIINSLINHTQDGCESKTCCVRVIYKNNYHLDLPVYYMDKDVALLAQTKDNVWEHSDSKEFKNWYFENRESFQTTKIIRFLKAWRDYNNLSITSIGITILATKYFSGIDNRDDLALLYTLGKIVENIKIERSIFKPVAPFDDLWKNLSTQNINNIIYMYNELYEDLSQALNATSLDRATTILREVFGKRFPSVQCDNSTYKEIYSGAKPWGI